MAAPRAAAASTQACLSAFFFALGALLLAIGRGIENGHGGVGLDMDVYHTNTSRPSSAVGEFFNASMYAAAISASPANTSAQVRAAVDAALAIEQLAIMRADMMVLMRRVDAASAARIDPSLDAIFSDEAVHKRWDARSRAYSPIVFGHLFAALGWLLSLPAVSALANCMLGGSTRSGSSTITYSFALAAALTVTEFVSEAGTADTAAWMERWSMLQRPTQNDPGELTAAQSFEMSYVLTVSRTLWLYAFDDLLLALATTTAAWLLLTSHTEHLAKAHAYLGVLIALVCILDFAFEVNRMSNWQWASNAVIVTTLTINVLLLPIWLLWLAVALHRLDRQGGAYGAATDGGNRVDPSASTKTSDVEMQKPADQIDMAM